MKTKHLLMAGLGLISFVGMSLSSVQKAFAQSRIVEDNRGRLYLAVPRGYGRPDSVCTYDNQYCFNVGYNPSACEPGGCYFPLSLINRRTDFRSPSYSGSRDRYAEFCRRAASNPTSEIAALPLRNFDCTIYGYPEELNDSIKRTIEIYDGNMDEIRRNLNKLRNNG